MPWPLQLLVCDKERINFIHTNNFIKFFIICCLADIGEALVIVGHNEIRINAVLRFLTGYYVVDRQLNLT